MNTKKTYNLLLAGVLPVVMLGCAASHEGHRLSVAPEAAVLMPDSTHSVKLDLTVRVPEKAFSRRSRLIVVPQLMSGDSLIAECTPLVLDAPVYARKLQRRKDLEGYTDSLSSYARPAYTGKTMEIPYRETVAVPDSLNDGRILAVVTTDGCGICSAIDTLVMADISNHVTLIEPKAALKVDWIVPEFVVRPKIMQARGEARLQFAINSSDIRMDLANNKVEMEQMLDKLKQIVGDTLATLNSVSIMGMSSVDGPYALNSRLAKGRAESARKWLFANVNLSQTQQHIFSVGSRPEGWEPVLQAMTADGHPDSLQVKEIVKKYSGQNDDVAEKYIRRLPCWNDIKKKYLAGDRKVEYVYTYTLKSFTTDAEMLAMYQTRPDAFNEDELLRVSTLKETREEKEDVYRTILHYFPQSKTAANNLAVILLGNGNSEQAEAVLESVDEYSPEMLNTRAALYVYRNDSERAIELLRSNVELPQARYNLALLEAQQRRLDEAWRLMDGYRDVNSAIVALSVNRNEEAASIMDGLKDDDSALASYVRALIAARSRDTEAFYTSLEKACSDENLRRRAAGEADFRPWQNESRFRQLLEERPEEGGEAL